MLAFKKIYYKSKKLHSNLEISGIKDQNGERFWGISDQSFAISTGTSRSLGSPWSSSKTHCNKQSAYHYNCAHWPQETPDEPCLCIQPAAMEKNRSQWLSQSPDPKITHTLPDVLMGENIGRWDWHEKFSWWTRSHFSFPLSDLLPGWMFLKYSLNTLCRAHFSIHNLCNPFIQNSPLVYLVIQISARTSPLKSHYPGPFLTELAAFLIAPIINYLVQLFIYYKLSFFPY